MSVTIVYDNNGFDPQLKTEWGFACWVEYGEHTILFDTGGDGPALLGNMDALGLDPQQIDVIVLSHEHGDHTGGLAALLAVNPDVIVMLPGSFSSSLKGVVQGAGAHLVEVDGAVEIVPGVLSTGEMGRSIIEQALVARSPQGLVMVTGCAHPGIVDMVEQALEVGEDHVLLVFGGFHLGNKRRGAIESIVAEFRRLGVEQVGPTHCSGDQAREIFSEVYGDGYHRTGVGWTISIGR
jgi:7,8-dihydropterin-6-yl-methyl-4-(beta-D-ribofuranosyl)aminobenzene 5'-phosphate synthase